MTNSFLNEFSAHNGPVFALDFHPEDKNLLASGGRDKLIKVRPTCFGMLWFIYQRSLLFVFLSDF